MSFNKTFNSNENKNKIKYVKTAFMQCRLSSVQQYWAIVTINNYGGRCNLCIMVNDLNDLNDPNNPNNPNDRMTESFTDD